jgi:integrase
MQRGTINKHGRGWRGSWREDGKRRTTKVCRTRGEAGRLLDAELRRLELGDTYVAPVTPLRLSALVADYLDRHQAQPATITKLRRQLRAAELGLHDPLAGDVRAEDVERWFNQGRYAPSTRASMAVALRQVYRWANATGRISDNPMVALRVAKPKRGRNQAPFEDWSQVELVAAEAGRWGALIRFMVDSGARPGEVRALEWRHVDMDAGLVMLPGAKSANAQRTVYLTSRGIAALRSQPRDIRSPLVFVGKNGRALNWAWWHREVWQPAVNLAGLAKRAPYACRHTFAFFSLRVGVPISDLARDMGHASIELTMTTYGHWVSDHGRESARLRERIDATSHAPMLGTMVEP